MKDQYVSLRCVLDYERRAYAEGWKDGPVWRFPKQLSPKEQAEPKPADQQTEVVSA